MWVSDGSENLLPTFMGKQMSLPLPTTLLSPLFFYFSCHSLPKEGHCLRACYIPYSSHLLPSFASITYLFIFLASVVLFETVS